MAVKGCERGIKWDYLLSLSMTTSMTILPIALGRPSIKSLVTSFHTLSGIGRGLSLTSQTMPNMMYNILFHSRRVE